MNVTGSPLVPYHNISDVKTMNVTGSPLVPLLTTVGVLLPANDYKDSGDTEVHIPTSQNSTGAQHYPFDNLMQNIINGFILLISLLGLVGNGVVFWLLGFRIKRNPYTTYILNLSIADFGILICLICEAILASVNHVSSWFPDIIFYLFFFTYSTSEFLLTAISIDRCVAVLFPLWHRCHRPPHLSAIACALIWILSFLIPGVNMIIVNVFFCAPLMLISTLTLYIKAYCKANQLQRGKLITAILLALLFFLIFAFPLNLMYIILYFCYIYFSSFEIILSLIPICLLCASLNSSINPLIYFLVAKRQRQSHTRVSIKVALERVFEDEQD